MTNQALIDGVDSQLDLRIDQLTKELELAALQQPGDVILVRPGRKLAHRIYQSCVLPSFLRRPGGWRLIPSHVLIVVGPGLYLHAMPGTGVREVKAENFPLSNASMLRVYRHKKIVDQDDDLQKKIQDAAAWHYAQWYNYKLNGTLWQRQQYSHSYCSQLIASIYERTGLYRFEKPSRLVLPIHLAKQLENSSDWLDVTQDYKRFEDMLHDDAVGKGYLNVHRVGVEVILTLPFEAAVALDRFRTSLERLERVHKMLGAVSSRVGRIGRRLGRKQNQSDTPLEIDIQDFLRPLTAIHLPSTENATEPKNWREENQRTFDRRVKRSRQRYMHFCETALAYCVAVSIMMENQIENPGQDSGRLMDALSFADELIDEIKKHEFIKMDKTLVPEADRRVVYMWSVAATAFFDLMGIRFAIANGHTDWQSVTETAKLELPLSKKWLAKGFAGDSLDDFKDQTRRLLAVLLYKNVRLVRLSEPDIDDAASLETAPS